ncbi:MAG: Arc family DNA-binding protein [Thermodesulfobacteriota bacterium]
MATMTIKNIPDDLYKKLRKSAADHRRSINSEFIVCLERALLAPKINIATSLAKIRKLRKKTSNFLLTDKELIKAKGEGRL